MQPSTRCPHGHGSPQAGSLYRAGVVFGWWLLCGWGSLPGIVLGWWLLCGWRSAAHPCRALSLAGTEFVGDLAANLCRVLSLAGTEFVGDLAANLCRVLSLAGTEFVGDLAANLCRVLSIDGCQSDADTAQMAAHPCRGLFLMGVVHVGQVDSPYGPNLFRTGRGVPHSYS